MNAKPCNKIFMLAMMLLLLTSLMLRAQKNAYTFEEEGYFIHPVSTPYGVVASDNYGSKLYLIKEGKINELVNRMGCGRFFTLSPCKQFIGFKWIYDNGNQVPALYDLENDTVLFLHEPVALCGQVSFSHEGSTAFTIGKNLIVQKDGHSNRYPLDYYANIAPLSPDGHKIVYNDNNDQLIMMDLQTGIKKSISNDSTGYVYPKWPDDGKKILYSSLCGQLFVYELESKANYSIGKGGNAVWMKDASHIVYQVNRVEDSKFMGSDIYVSDYQGNKITNISNTDDVHEMAPTITDSNTIVYHTYHQRQIIRAGIKGSGLKSNDKELLFVHEDPLSIAFKKHTAKQLKQLKSIIKIDDVPYIHQVYDAPDFHNGSGSCAPATAVMALAHLNILPAWPTNVTHLTPHVSNYGSYIADKYHFNGYAYDDYTSPYGSDSWGAYSYMWDGASPGQDRMRSYLENHGITSNQEWTTSCTFAKTIAEIDSGYTHPICSWITHSGHLTLATGYVQGQHTLIFNDPYGNKNTPGYPSYDGTDAYYDWPGYNNGYQNLDPDGSHGGVAWTVWARGREKDYEPMVIDDLDFGHGFYIYNESPSHMKYFRDAPSGYKDHMWWTYSTSSAENVCYVTWTPALDSSGIYNVMAYIPAENAAAENAAYSIYHKDGDTVVYIDQSAYADEWVSLGEYYFDVNDTGYVYLGDATGTSGRKLGFDAVKWQKGELSYRLLTQDVSCYGLGDGNATVSIEKGKNPITYKWSHDIYNTSSNANNLSAGTYRVTVTDADNNVVVRSFTITTPEAISVFYNVEQPSALVGGDGKIIATVDGGTPPYNYLWNNGVSDSVNSDIQTGQYTITITDNNQCRLTDTVSLTSNIDKLLVGPNPFNETLRIGYHLKTPGHVNISLYNMAGTREKIIIDAYQDKGIYQYTINMAGLSSGMYILRFISPEQQDSKKLIRYNIR